MHSISSAFEITFPSLLPVLFLNIVYSIIDSFSRADNPVMTVITNSAFSDFNYSYACAISLVYSAVILLVIGVVYLLIGRKTAKI